MQTLILPKDINSLENANTLSACNLLTSNSSQTISEVTAHAQTLRRNGIHVSAAEYELGRPYIVIGNHRESCTDRASPWIQSRLESATFFYRISFGALALIVFDKN